MPAPARLADAAAFYRLNEQHFDKGFKGVEPDEWVRSPKETSNSLLWIAGHLVWARSMAAKLLGSAWTRPWLDQFARGAKPGDQHQAPSPEEVVRGWHEVSNHLNTALENASDEALDAPFRPPSFDGKIGGMVSFLAHHEAYHIGQIAYLRRWLGHDGVAG
jgi:uncharacterized damage-inducible protein DinB